jgi:hypothetical protein
MNFKGIWRLRNGWKGEVNTFWEGHWEGRIFLGATTVHAEWDTNGDAIPSNKDLDLIERLEWRARI